MRINHNIAALNTYRQLSANTASTSKSLEKLSSGLRINRAGDDAAGLAISEKMRGQIRGLDQATRNANDGISLIQTAEGALNETHSILQRMRELAVQSSNDTNTAEDRAEIQKEINQLKTEITRISTSTEFNNKKLLDGSMEGKLIAKVSGTPVDGVAVSLKDPTGVVDGKNYTVNVSVPAADDDDGGTTPPQVTGNLYSTAAPKIGGDEVEFTPSGVDATVEAGTYVFSYDGSDWSATLDGEDIDFDGATGFAKFGLSITGTPAEDDVFTLEITKAAEVTVGGAIEDGDISDDIEFEPDDVADRKILEQGTYKFEYVKGSDDEDDKWTVAFKADGGSDYGEAKDIDNIEDFGISYVDEFTPEDNDSFILNINTLTTANQAGNFVSEAKIGDDEITFDPEGLDLEAGTYKFSYDATDEKWKVESGGNLLDDIDPADYGITLPETPTEDISLSLKIESAGNDQDPTDVEFSVTGNDDLEEALGFDDDAEVDLEAGDYEFKFENDNWHVKFGDGDFVEVGDNDALAENYGITLNASYTPKADDVFTFTYPSEPSGGGGPVVTIVDDEGNDVTQYFNVATDSDELEAGEHSMKVDVTMGDAMVFHIGSNEGQSTSLTIREMDSVSLGIDMLDLSTRTGANEAIETIDAAIADVSSQRAALGAMQNRLEHTINNLGTTSENLSASESRIRDVDMAQEMMEFTKNNILSQASQAMLAQANMQPQSVLQLLQ